MTAGPIRREMWRLHISGLMVRSRLCAVAVRNSGPHWCLAFVLNINARRSSAKDLEKPRLIGKALHGRQAQSQ